MMEEGSMIAEEEKQDVYVKKKAHKKRKKLLYQTIRNQVEFYFSDANLLRDRFLGKLIQDDPNVPLEVFMRCNKILALVSSADELAKALQGSDVLVVSDDKQTVRRVTEVQIKSNVDECIIYVENVPADANHEFISNIFSEYGKVVYVSIPKFHGTHTNKGFAFVEFDTPNEAAKALQVFWDKGCCLPTHMPPEKLCSIKTFESNTENSKHHHLEPRKDIESSSQPDGKENIEEGNKTKMQASETDKSSLTSKDVASTDEPVTSESTEVDQGSKSDETKITKSSKKRKIKDEEQNSNEAELEEQKSKKFKVEEDKSVLDTDESTQAESGATENKKRHRKKKKKTKEDNNEEFAYGLLILSKPEWKRLRNKYLDMQRQKMKQVKNRLYQAQSYYHNWKSNDDVNKSIAKMKEGEETANPQDTGTGRVKHSPGLIVKVSFDKPLSSVPTFKSEAKAHSCVQYVDASEGSWEAFLRCSTSSDARALVERQPWPQMSVIQGDEENSYWEKIKQDRAEKINTKSVGRNKERGKKKLLRKAEKMRGTHLLFN